MLKRLFVLFAAGLVSIVVFLGMDAGAANAQITEQEQQQMIGAGTQRQIQIQMMDESMMNNIHRFNFSSRRFFGRPRVVIDTDRDFFLRENLFRRHPHFRRIFPNQVFPRRIIIVDRDNTRNILNFSNFLTGPNSVNINTATISVSDSFFRQIVNNVDVDQNFDIDVNTGNNTISFNTVVGNISTGDVNINLR